MGEILRYGIVGIAHNLGGYLVYLLITWLGTDPKIAVAILYPIGTLVSYVAHKRWTFGHEGAVGQSLSRFVAMQGSGYFLNIGIMYAGYDVLGFPHQLVQLFAMGFLAVTFFLISKFVVFKDADESGSA